MAIPACLWRRTGEIYKGNKEFAALVNVSLDKLRNVRRTFMATKGALQGSSGGLVNAQIAAGSGHGS
ncbi:hypothetical protein G6F38_008576 [Rhizopus arrhizus]|nr:hypothetical protein G6F38_008576 [Rhizopus arrhizus]